MSSDAITQTKRPSVLGGAMIIAGTAVGAGMFSIPVMTAGVWFTGSVPVSYTHLRAHETGRNLVCRLLLEKKKAFCLKTKKFFR